MSTFWSFVAEEIENYQGEGRNRIFISGRQVERYREFIDIIMERYREAGRAMASAREPFDRLGNPDAEEPTRAEINAALERIGFLTPALHLEIESFYVFAKVLLDKIANFIQCYFGQGQGCSLNSHHDFKDSHDRYGRQKGLVYPEGFAESLALLYPEVCEYRNKLITHQNNPRMTKGTGYSLSDPEVTFLGFGSLHPKGGDFDYVPMEAKGLQAVLEDIDRYLAQVIELVKTNRSKSKFELKETGQGSN